MPDDEVAPDNARRPRQRGPSQPAIIRDRWDILLLIAVGGAMGTLARWGVGQLIPHDIDQIAFSTWIVNATGAFAIGVLVILVVDVWPANRYLRPFVVVGILGGYTTFSTYMLDTRTLVAADELGLAAIYLLGTLITGLVAVFVGMLAARRLLALQPRRRLHQLPVDPDVTEADLAGLSGDDDPSRRIRRRRTRRTP